MTQFIYHIIYLIKKDINSKDTSQQPFNMSTLPEKVKSIKKEKEKSIKKVNIDDELMELMFSIYD